MAARPLALLPLLAVGSALPPVMEGYDVVSYRSLSPGGKGVKGMATINSTVEVAGVGTYDFYFSSSENKDLFDSDPWKFAPKYGGF